MIHKIDAADRRQRRLPPAACRWQTPRGSLRLRSGAAAVEFALVAPIVFFMLFVCIEVGRMLMAQHGLETAAREGCRAAVAWNTSSEDIEQLVAARLAPFGIAGYTVTTTPDPPNGACQWELVSVQVRVPYRQVSWLPLPGFFDALALTGTSTLPQESDQCE